MNTKILAVAAAALAISAGAASAQSVNTNRQAGAALFDQGGVFDANQSNVIDSSTTASYVRGTTAEQPRTIRSAVDNPTGVPSDTRNEGGLGLFDRVSK